MDHKANSKSIYIYIFDLKQIQGQRLIQSPSLICKVLKTIVNVMVYITSIKAYLWTRGNRLRTTTILDEIAFILSC